MSREDARFMATYHYFGSKGWGYWILDGREISDAEFDALFPKDEVFIEQKENPNRRKQWMGGNKSY